MEKTHRERMSIAIGAWIAKLNVYPGWKEWKRRQVGHTLHFDDPLLPTSQDMMFSFNDGVEKEHAVVYQYICLESTILSLKDCEHYFRKYPFRKNEVSRHDHITNICEMYFNRFYEFRERLKKYLNALKVVSSDPTVGAGLMIKSFDKIFERELRARNGVHHDSRFGDVAIDRVYLTGVLSATPEDKGWTQEHRTIYRKLTAEWAERVRRRGEKMNEYMEVVGAISLADCDFLIEP